MTGGGGVEPADFYWWPCRSPSCRVAPASPKGVTRGLTAGEAETKARACDITGPSFQGISERLRRLELSGSAVVGAQANPLPPVVGKIDAYCKPDGSNYDERFMAKLSIIAFSDPNDLLSYALPVGYEDKYLDSRLSPEVVNVSVNIVDAIDLFGMGEFVNPMAAHDSYEDDERVIGLMVGGVGYGETNPKVAAECSWLETLVE